MKSDYKMYTKFKNKHGEEFTLLFNDLKIMLRSDETDNKEIGLFNESFNIYSKQELGEIGKALQRWSEL